MKKIIILALVSVAVSSCAREGSPHEQGELLTTTQIMTLGNDQSMNGKLVTIEGFAGFCSHSSFITRGKHHTLAIYPDGFCEGKKLIDAKIEIDRGSTALTGEKHRNYAGFIDSKNLSNETMTFMTDDYQNIKNGRLKFSGKIVYDGKRYFLNNVTIHQ